MHISCNSVMHLIDAVKRKAEAKLSMQVPLIVACTAPFLAGPRVQISYALGKQVMSQSLALPVITPKFCTPPDSSVPREAFFQRWRTLEGGHHIPIPSSASRMLF